VERGHLARIGREIFRSPKRPDQAAGFSFAEKAGCWVKTAFAENAEGIA